MIIKIGDEWIAEELDIPIEKRNKLIDQISNIVGDFSYSFDITSTARIRKLLGLPSTSNTDKFTGFNATLLTTDGVQLYIGKLRVDRYNDKVISCSFYSGNTNWLTAIEGNIDTLNFSHSVSQDVASYIATWSNTDGFIVPVFDKGLLRSRGARTLLFDVDLSLSEKNQRSDFRPFFYVHTIVSKIFEEAGIKVTGALLTDPIYKKLITTNNNIDAIGPEIVNRTVKARNATSQGLTTSYAVINFTDITTNGFYDGSKALYSTLTYTADIEMFVNIEAHIVLSTSKTIQVQTFKNGVTAGSYRLGTGEIVDINFTEQVSTNPLIRLLPGETLQVRILCTSGTANVLVGSWLKITPVYFKKIFPASVLSDMKRIDFLTNIFNMFNVLPVYNPLTSTISLNLFKDINNNEEIDISKFVESYEMDTTEIIQDYAKNNRFVYTQIDVPEVEAYNSKYTKQFASGNIESNNIHLQEETNLIELDFVAPYVYSNAIYLLQFILTNYLESELSSDITSSVGSVSNSAGNAVFNTGSLSVTAGQIMRHEGFTNPSYNGDFIVTSGGTSYQVYGVPYISNDTGTTSLVLYQEQNQEDQIIALAHTYSGPTICVFDVNASTQTNVTSYPLAVFHLYNTTGRIDEIRQSLSFDVIQEDANYQVGMCETYYDDIRKILINPLMPICRTYLPTSVFNKLDSSKFVRIKTNDFNERFYLNSITDYQSSYNPCELRVIKV